MDDLYVMVLVIFVIALGATAGRMADPQFKCSIMRYFLKKNYVVVNFGDKRGRTIFQSVVNADDGVIIMGSRLWVIKGGRIYNAILKEGKLQIDRSKNQGYTFKDDDMKFTPGTPNIFLNPDTLTPLDFFGPEAPVKPDEIGSTLLAWVSTQVNKNLNKFASMDMWIKVSTILCVLLIVGLYILHSEHEDQNKQYAALRSSNEELNAKINRFALAMNINLNPATQNTTTEQQVNGQIIVNGHPAGGG